MTIEPLDRELARARQILGAWTGFRRLSSDEADVIVRMIAQGIAEGRKYGLELAGAEWPTDGKNHVEELEDGLGAKARAILAEVARRFSDPNFDLDNVAGALGLSRRYVQKLLKGTGKSFTEHVAGCRLERAFAMLTDPRHLHLPITDIAFAVGFGDVSHFNRMFHKRFGETPSGVRAASIMREQGDPATPHNARATPMNAGICRLREHPSAT